MAHEAAIADRQPLGAHRVLARNVGAFAVVALVVGAILLHFHDQFWWPPDDGAYAHVAQRILAGEVLNRDVQDIHAGYVNFANAAALWLFGERLVSLRYPLAFLGLVQAGLVFVVFAARFGVAAAIAPPIALTALAFVQFLDPTAHWYCLFLVISIVACLQLWPPGSTRRLVMLGFLVGLVAMFRQLTGVIAAISVFAFLVLEAHRHGASQPRLGARLGLAIAAFGLGGYLAFKAGLFAAVTIGIWPLLLVGILAAKVCVPNRELAQIAGQLAGGAAVAVAPLVAYHAYHSSIGSWYSDIVEAAVALTTLPFFDRAGFDVLLLLSVRQLLAMSSVAEVVNGAYWIVLVLLPTALGFQSVHRLLRAPRDLARAPLPFMAVFYALVSLHYEIPAYLYFSAGLTLAGLLWSAESARNRLVAGAVTVALTSVGLVYHAGQSLERKILGTVAGIRAPAVECPRLAKSALRISPNDCETYGHLVELIQRETRPGDFILALPTNSELYFLSDRRNSTRFFNSALGLAAYNGFADAMERLDASSPALVVHRADDKYNDPSTDRLMAWVRNGYVPVDSYRGFDIYRKRPPSH